MPTPSGSSPHRWRFFRAGGLDQVRLETGADLAHLDQLDPKLWVALACPVKGLDFDEQTLALIDTDNDGRVRAPELLAALDCVDYVTLFDEDTAKELAAALRPRVYVKSADYADRPLPERAVVEAARERARGARSRSGCRDDRGWRR